MIVRPALGKEVEFQQKLGEHFNFRCGPFSMFFCNDLQAGLLLLLEFVFQTFFHDLLLAF